MFSISIRAPARGATYIGEDNVIHVTISIRAPARGATGQLSALQQKANISIRAPARGATYIGEDNVIHVTISIRAPARGATSLRVEPSRSIENFNPRSREGSDMAEEPFDSIITFQSALPRGERLSLCINAMTLLLFQSALPRGERLLGRQCRNEVCSISIRAPARGATTFRNYLLMCKEFQSALPRGERLRSLPFLG